jgi:hypothetical protein
VKTPVKRKFKEGLAAKGSLVRTKTILNADWGKADVSTCILLRGSMVYDGAEASKLKPQSSLSNQIP